MLFSVVIRVSYFLQFLFYFVELLIAYNYCSGVISWLLVKFFDVINLIFKNNLLNVMSLCTDR